MRSDAVGRSRHAPGPPPPSTPPPSPPRVGPGPIRSAATPRAATRVTPAARPAPLHPTRRGPSPSAGPRQAVRPHGVLIAGILPPRGRGPVLDMSGWISPATPGGHRGGSPRSLVPPRLSPGRPACGRGPTPGAAPRGPGGAGRGPGPPRVGRGQFRPAASAEVEGEVRASRVYGSGPVNLIPVL
jgi:hypothetical protein